jgi:hypothetical protein
MYRLSDTLRATHTQDGAILLDIQQGRIFTLNVVGSRILELLTAGSSTVAIADEISRQFEVSRETADQDSHQFIHALTQHRLIEEIR